VDADADVRRASLVPSYNYWGFFTVKSRLEKEGRRLICNPLRGRAKGGAFQKSGSVPLFPSFFYCGFYGFEFFAGVGPFALGG
jgi:hypothetical protein